MPESIYVRTTGTATEFNATFAREYAVRDVVANGLHRLSDRYDNRIDAEHARDRYNMQSLTNPSHGGMRRRGWHEYVLERRFVVNFEEDLNRAPGIRRTRDILAAVLRTVNLPRGITEDSFIREYLVGFNYTHSGYDPNEWYRHRTFARWGEARAFRDEQRDISARGYADANWTIRLRLRTLFVQTPAPQNAGTRTRQVDWEDALAV